MSDQWERDLLEKLATNALTEQRRARQWKIFFRLVWLIIIMLIIGSIWFGKENRDSIHFNPSSAHAAVIKLNGVIQSESDSAEKLRLALEDAYKDSGTRGIIIDANSPGGSPVLSGLAYDEIRRQKKQHPSIPIYTVVNEVCASGCYYIASATDKIFVNRASMVGSIGVISSGFGFTGLMDKLGIDRRLRTAGSNKAMGDPFSPDNPKQDAIFQQMLDELHQQFIQAVKTGRGKRLKETPDIFSGRVWLGSQSITLGLADGLGTVQSVAKEHIKTDTLIDYTRQDNWSDRVARQIGMQFSAGLFSELQKKWF